MPDKTVRLSKLMAQRGVCSRREADVFIEQGLVSVNGVVVNQLGT
ncbi:MAG: S4 domain-containing protein, partial [Blastocatellia bacterium]